MAEGTVNAMSDIEKVKMWAAAKKLSEATTAAIISLGFDSMEAVSLISQEDFAKSKIPVGQIKLLMKAVKQTFLSEDAIRAEDDSHSGHAQPNQDGATGSSDNNVTNSVNTGDAYVDEVLGQLQQQQHGQPITANSGRNIGFLGENFSWQDPQIYIKSLTNTQDNYHDIVDFVSACGTSFNDETLLSHSSTGQLIFKSGPSKPKLELISLCQWSMASLAILYKMLEEGSLSQANIIDYLSYTTRIYQLITTHDMTSVLFYDREYRRLQSRHKFRWGTDIPHIQTVFLKPKMARPSKPQPHRGTQYQGKFILHSASGKEICKKFNSRQGCTLSACKFEHSCNMPGCGKLHSASTHSFPHPKN